MEFGLREFSATGRGRPGSPAAQTKRSTACGRFSQPADAGRTDSASIHEFKYEAAPGVEHHREFRSAGAKIRQAGGPTTNRRRRFLSDANGAEFGREAGDHGSGAHAVRYVHAAISRLFEGKHSAADQRTEDRGSVSSVGDLDGVYGLRGARRDVRAIRDRTDASDSAESTGGAGRSTVQNIGRTRGKAARRLELVDCLRVKVNKERTCRHTWCSRFCIPGTRPGWPFMVRTRRLSLRGFRE